MKEEEKTRTEVVFCRFLFGFGDSGGTKVSKSLFSCSRSRPSGRGKSSGGSGTPSSGNSFDSLAITSISSVRWPRRPRAFFLMVVRREARWFTEVDSSPNSPAKRNDVAEDRFLFFVWASSAFFFPIGVNNESVS